MKRGYVLAFLIPLLMYFFKRKRHHNKKSKWKQPKDKSVISKEQMNAITDFIIRKKRLMVYAESM
jgi:hypothetical protein